MTRHDQQRRRRRRCDLLLPPTWRDADRCLWYAETVVPTPAYEEHAPAADERLDGANFREATLSDAAFLAGCLLVEADITDAVLDGADLSDADLRRATFRDVDAHGTSFRGANLHDAAFVFADLRGADFRDARLYRAGLTDVRLNLETAFGDRTVYEDELEAGDGDDVTAPADSVQWLYRELQRVYDENAFPERVRDYYCGR